MNYKRIEYQLSNMYTAVYRDSNDFPPVRDYAFGKGTFMDNILKEIIDTLNTKVK